MKRAVALLALIAFALALPCAHICTVAAADGAAVSALDLCSPASPGTSGQAVTMAEQAYDMPVFIQIAQLPDEKPLIYESKVLPPSVRPPLV